jgi:hypothetical protein
MVRSPRKRASRTMWHVAHPSRRALRRATQSLSRIPTSSLRNGFAVVAGGACEASVSKDGHNAWTRGHPSRRGQEAALRMRSQGDRVRVERLSLEMTHCHSWGASVLATRKPMTPPRLPEGSLSRLAERRSCRSLLQEPPRTTRENDPASAQTDPSDGIPSYVS